MEVMFIKVVFKALMIFVKKIKEDGFITREELRQFLIFLNPLAPHITSEMYERVFNGEILDQSWPKYDEKDLVKSTVEIAVQVNSKIITKLDIDTSMSQQEILDFVKQDAKIRDVISNKTIVKEIYVPNRIVNIIVK